MWRTEPSEPRHLNGKPERFVPSAVRTFRVCKIRDYGRQTLSHLFWAYRALLGPFLVKLSPRSSKSVSLRALDAPFLLFPSRREGFASYRTSDSFRERLKLLPGTKMMVFATDDAVVLQKVELLSERESPPGIMKRIRSMFSKVPIRDIED